jgi:hypothetical protein
MAIITVEFLGLYVSHKQDQGAREQAGKFPNLAGVLHLINYFTTLGSPSSNPLN